jgi:hypothetical protein
MVYLIQSFISDVPKDVQEKIRHELFLDQSERWSSQMTRNELRSAVQSNGEKSRTDDNQIGQRVYYKANETNLQRRTKRK